MGQRHWGEGAGEKDGQHNKDERMNGGQRDKMTKGETMKQGNVCENGWGNKTLVGLKARKRDRLFSGSGKMQKKGERKKHKNERLRKEKNKVNTVGRSRQRQECRELVLKSKTDWQTVEFCG